MKEWKDTEYGKAPVYWREVTLGEISKQITDGSHFSPKPQKIGKYMCSVKDMTYNHFNFSDCKLISESDYRALVSQGCQPIKDDILISKDGANCLDLIFVFNQDEELVILSSIAIVRLLPNIDNNFIRYFLLSPNCQFLMRNNFITGSAIPRVVLKDFKRVPILLPPLPEQRAIAGVLSSLDDKIDLLHRQNKTLEVMAETLFRQWFVEEAYEGWEETIINSVITVKGGTTPSTKISEYWNGDIYWTSPRDLANHTSIFIFDTERKITKKGLTQISSGLLPIGSVLLSSRAPIGYLAITDIPIAINQGYIGIICNKKVSNQFMFLWCRQNMDVIKNAGNGSVFPEISKSIFKSLDFQLPPPELLQKFDIEVKPIFSKVKNNQIQIRTLEKLRDTLLPKLMSGEVRMKYEMEKDEV
ncbi:MAG: restriction endonuclease subunit S [Spirochaetales bacterium]|nr:restriction endonuclease subunit S [Spirochaetales bacterium]